MFISLKENPQVKAFVQTYFPGYRKRDVSVYVTTGVSMSSYWDGGSRDEWYRVDLASRRITPVNAWQGNYDRSQNGPTKSETGNGIIYVCGGTFWGKPATLQINVHPADLATLGVNPS